MNKSPQYNQQSKSEVEEIMYLPKHGKWRSQHLYLMPEKEYPKQQYLKVVTFSDPSFSKKHIYVNEHAT